MDIAQLGKNLAIQTLALAQAEAAGTRTVLPRHVARRASALVDSRMSAALNKQPAVKRDIETAKSLLTGASAETYRSMIRDVLPTSPTRSLGVAVAALVDPTDPAAVDTSRSYTLWYDALWCRKETTYDRGSRQDEPFLIVAVTDWRREGDLLVPRIQTTRHPSGPMKWYRDVDDKNMRKGPRAVVWNGDERTINLDVYVMEADEGEPDYLVAKIDEATALARTILITYKPDLAWIPDVVGWAVKTILEIVGYADDDADDLIQFQSRFLTGPQLHAAANALRISDPRSPDHDSPSVDHRITSNLKTEHKGLGAHYYAYFSVVGRFPVEAPI